MKVMIAAVVAVAAALAVLYRQDQIGPNAAQLDWLAVRK
jgi:hypothetical protein